MDLRVLRYFLAAVHTQSISGAAERLHVTQPTLSRQFMDLEEELGHKLFERTNRKLHLTAKGELFYERAKMIVELCDRTKAEIRCEEEMSGEIRIAAGETPGFKSLAKAIRCLHEVAPKVRCHIMSGSEETVRAELHSGLTDFGLFVGATDVTQYNYLRLKAKDRWGILTKTEGPFKTKNAVSAKDLLGEPLLCSRQAFMRNEFAGWFGFSAKELNIIATFNLLYNAYILAEEGLGHVLALEGIINPLPSSNLKWLPFLPALSADLIVAWDKNRALSPAAQKLLDFLRKEEGIVSHE